MTQNKRPSRQHYVEHYSVVLERTGLTEDDYLHHEFEMRIQGIFNSYWSARERQNLVAIKNALDAVLEALELRRKSLVMLNEALQVLEPIHSEINMAARLATLPPEEREEKIERFLNFRAWSDHLTREELADSIAAPIDPDDTPNHPAPLTLEQNTGIQFLRDNPESLAKMLKRQPGDYRKDDETALVVEPALELLDEIEFTASRKGPSRIAFLKALFDLLGIEPKRRPSVARINMIARARRQKKSRRA